MSKSRLSHKLALCDLIDQLDDKACINVIRSIHDELDCDNLNMLLCKIILECTSKTTTDSLVKIENVIKDNVANMDDNNVDNSRNNCKNFKKLKEKHSSMLQLPIDLICKTSLFLNENDVFSFEQSCRLFYQIVNNSSYVNESNTFKSFKLTPRTLIAMTQTQHNFYKYCKATTLTIRDFRCHGYADEMLREFEKSKIVCNYDKWFTAMLKSIKSLYLIDAGCYHPYPTMLFNEFPVDLLFDPIESNLENIHLWPFGFDKKSTPNIMKFVDQYKNVKKKFEDKGKKIKVLNSLQLGLNGEYCPIDIFCIESKHIWTSTIDWKFWDYLYSCNQLQSVKTITIGRSIPFLRMPSIDFDSMKPKDYLQLKTLRLFNLWYCDDKIKLTLLENEKVIEILNFQNSVKNMTIGIVLDHMDNIHDINDHWKPLLINVLKKKYYFNLTNVNILLYCEYHGNKLRAKKNFVDWIFGILKENKNVLKYQFKQLRIGLQYMRFYNVIEWNTNNGLNNDIDKFLIDNQAKWNQSHQSKFEHQSNYQKFQQIEDQWLD